MAILQEIGPDTLIPCFSVNISDNEDVNICNAVNTAIFNDLCHDSAEESEQRMPLIVTSSTMSDHQYSSKLEHFKKRLGVRKGTPFLFLLVFFVFVFVSLKNQLFKNKLALLEQRHLLLSDRVVSVVDPEC